MISFRTPNLTNTENYGHPFEGNLPPSIPPPLPLPSSISPPPHPDHSHTFPPSTDSLCFSNVLVLSERTATSITVGFVEGKHKEWGCWLTLAGRNTKEISGQTCAAGGGSAAIRTGPSESSITRGMTLVQSSIWLSSAATV